jgi:ribosome-associated toxin RatA of RatAB toxin-antitoxin module
LTKSVFQIDASKDRLFEIIADFNRWSEWFPSCKEAKIVTDKGATVQVELTLASVKTITMGLEFDLTPTQLINFRKYSGKDVKEYAGSFRLMNASDGAGTVVMGEMEMDAGSMVPKFMVGKIMEKSLAHTAPVTSKYASAEVAAAAPAGGVPGAAPGVGAAQPLPVRRKRMVHVLQSADGYRVWVMGRTHFYKFE